MTIELNFWLYSIITQQRLRHSANFSHPFHEYQTYKDFPPTKFYILGNSIRARGLKNLILVCVDSKHNHQLNTHQYLTERHMINQIMSYLKNTNMYRSD